MYSSFNVWSEDHVIAGTMLTKRDSLGAQSENFTTVEPFSPSCKRFLTTYSLCHYNISFRDCVIGWNPNYYHLEQLPFLQHTSIQRRLLHQIWGGRLGDMGFLATCGEQKTWRHEGDLRFWDILGRWLYRVKVGFFFYIFLLPEEVKDWSLSANWPLTLMERIHLEKDNLPRFVFSDWDTPSS